jgi:hypothetical protein
MIAGPAEPQPFRDDRSARRGLQALARQPLRQ